MSRVGKKPIPLPKDVEIKLEGALVTVKGPKGVLSRRVPPNVQVARDGDNLLVNAGDGARNSVSLQGLFRVLIANMVTGVTKGFERVLEIVGVGYKAELKGRTAVFNLGYSNPVNFECNDPRLAFCRHCSQILSDMRRKDLQCPAALDKSFSSTGN